MKKHIYFVTGNTIKFKEASVWFKDLAPDIELEQYKLDLPEIQSLDIKEVAISKAKDAWSKLQVPLLVDDEGFYLEQYPLFPGTFSKFIRQTIGIKNIIKLADENRNASVVNCLVYIDSQDNYKVFEGATKGKLIDPMCISSDRQLKGADFLIPEGYDQVVSEIKNPDQLKKFHYRYHAIKNLISFLNTL